MNIYIFLESNNNTTAVQGQTNPSAEVDEYYSTIPSDAVQMRTHFGKFQRNPDAVASDYLTPAP